MGNYADKLRSLKWFDRFDINWEIRTVLNVIFQLDRCNLTVRLLALLTPLSKPMSLQSFPRRVRLLNPTLFVWVAALALVIAPARSVAQSTPESPSESKSQSTPQSKSKPPSAKPIAKSSDVKSPIAATSPKKNIDWWVPGLLGASVMGAGVGMTLIMRRSQPQLATQPPDGLIYTPKPQVFHRTKKVGRKSSWISADEI